MANHAQAKTGKRLNANEVDANIRKIVAEKLNNIFNVEFEDGLTEKYWIIRYKDDGYLAMEMWISDDVDYNEEPTKLISEQSVLEFRHGHDMGFMWWVEGVVRENLGKIYNAQMFDDGCEIDPKPNPENFETFETFCSKQGDEHTKELKKHWFPDWQKSEIPVEIIEKLNLDFQVK